MSTPLRSARRVTALAASVALLGGAGAMAVDLPALASPTVPTSTTHTARTLRTTATLNVRTGPATSYRVVTVLRKGTTVASTGRSSHGFTQIRLGGADRWVSTKYLIATRVSTKPVAKRVVNRPAVNKPAAAAKPARIVKITTTALDVRSVPTTAYQRWAEIPKGGKITATGVVRNGRAQIVWGTRTAWVTAKYLVLPTPVKPTASHTSVRPPKSTPPKPAQPKPAAKPVTPKPVPTPKPPAKPVAQPLPKIIATRYATTELIIRSTAGADFADLGTVPTGTALSITGASQNGRAQIIYNGAARWVTAQYLSATKPLVGAAGGNGGTSATRGPAGIVSYAQQYLGTPYSWGGGSLTGTSVGFGSGAGINGFDCSGLVRAAVYSASGGGLVLPRTTWDQVNTGQVVSNDARRPGDLIFFQTDGFSWSHVGIYIGGGKMIDAPRPGAYVRIDDLTSGYYLTVKQTTRRVL